MSQFTISGRFQSRDGWRSFEKSVDAENENVAREHVLAEFGSQHNLRRTQVELDEVEA
jgi:large subunit ribosomal protein LX